MKRSIVLKTACRRFFYLFLALIGRCGVKRFGSPLFFPDAGKKPELPGLLWT